MAKIELAPSEEPCELKSIEPVPERLPLVVDFQSVSKSYDIGTSREFTAIKDVTFSVEDIPKIGEFIGVAITHSSNFQWGAAGQEDV